jgi:hypothetical protein
MVQRERLELHALEVAGRHARFKAGTAAVLRPAIRKPRAAATTVTQTVALSLHRIGAMSITLVFKLSGTKVVNGNFCIMPRKRAVVGNGCSSVSYTAARELARCSKCVYISCSSFNAHSEFAFHFNLAGKVRSQTQAAQLINLLILCYQPD